MRILVIGNGFDQEHKLKTGYIDFLEFVKWCDDSYKKNSSYDSYKVDKYTVDKYHELKKTNQNIIKDLYELTSENFWINYFWRVKSSIGKNWIDFESEIARLIKLFEKARIEYLNNATLLTTKVASIEYYNEYNAAINEKIPGHIEGKTFDEHLKIMIDDLKKLIGALQIYLLYWVEDKEIDVVNSDIDRIRPDALLSFNYTHTYKKVYGGVNSSQECYIHGEAKDDPDNCNIVLGVDDFESENNYDKEYLIDFKKYYQRLEKDTSTLYKEWIKEIKNDVGVNHEVFIFGHSLDITDKEILAPIIELPNVKTTIFYHKKEKRGELIANLIRITSKETAERKIQEKKIVFRLQEESKKSPKVLGIRNDIQKLHSIFDMKFEDIDKLIEKYEKKIEEQDDEYFITPAILLDFIDALEYTNLYKPEYTANIKKIASKIVDRMNMGEYINGDEWTTYDYFGELVYKEKVDQMVEYINKIIEDKNSSSTLDNYSLINKGSYKTLITDVYNKCEKDKIFDEKSITELVSIFEEEPKRAEEAFKEIKSKILHDDTFQDKYKRIYIALVEKEMDKRGFMFYE